MWQMGRTVMLVLTMMLFVGSLTAQSATAQTKDPQCDETCEAGSAATCLPGCIPKGGPVPPGPPQSCPFQTFGQPLKNPREILPDAQGVLRLDLVTRVVDFACVPAFGLATCACNAGNCPAGCSVCDPTKGLTFDAATGACACPAGLIYDTTSAACTCNTGQSFDASSHQCVACPSGSQDPSCSAQRTAGAAPAPTCPGGQQWSMNKMPLRMYGASIDPSKPIDPDDPTDANTAYSFPAPTMRVRKSSAPGKTDGTRLRINLYNRLPYQDYPGDPNRCNPQCTVEPPQPIGAADPKLYPNGQLVCMNHPDCFHGDNVTNLHFHGTHISPQQHQDFVLLALLPKGAKYEGAHMHPHGETQVGDYWYDIDPIPWNQAEGTHWFHPHKHGSTAVQVLNGMAGALLIEGPFDDWLNALYEVTPENRDRFEKVLVLQQVWPSINFYNPANHLKVYPPALLVNGQASPVITMYPGEVQRWRFINATMQAGAQLALDAPDPLVWKQIAQDGVQFSEANYLAQPIYGDQPTIPAPFSPGNRADFLVQAPLEPGTYLFTHNVVGAVHERVRDTLETRRQGLRQAFRSAEKETTTDDVTFGGAPLFTLVVEGEGRPMALPRTTADDPACNETPKPAHCWPAMPEFLEDLDPAGATSRTVEFSMEGTAPGVQPNTFTINGDGYDPDCAAETMVLGSTEEWTVTNDSPLAHPFHIHINPFQLSEYNGTEYPENRVWFDTLALPVPTGPYNPKAEDCDPAEKPCFRFLSKFEDFTGEYVLHCHFLGHEDRGMMENVQVVCPPPHENKFGRPRSGQPECTYGEYKPASCACKDMRCREAADMGDAHTGRSH